MVRWTLSAVVWAWLTGMLGLTALGPSPAWAQQSEKPAGAESGRERQAAELLPSSTVLYVEMPRPGELLDLVLKHPLRGRISELEVYRQALDSPQYRQFRAALSVLEARLGAGWEPTIRDTLAGGVYLAFDAEHQGQVMLIKSRDAEHLRKVVDTLLALARQRANNEGEPDPVKATLYRGIDAYGIGEARLALAGSWLVVTNKGELGKAVLDQYLDGGDATLSSLGQFRRARSAASGRAAGWMFLNVAAIRQSGAARALFREQTDNPLAELLLGGLLGNLGHAPYLTGTLQVTPEAARLDLAMPHTGEWISPARAYYFGGEASQAAPLPRAREMLLGVSTYRDFSSWWLHAGDLYDEATNDKLAQAESTLSTLFSGKDFGEDVLGAIQPGLQLVIARQTFGDAGPVPAIKLPAFALSVTLKDSERVRPEMRRTFQSLIGFLNVVGAMNGQPQLDLDMDKVDGVQVVSARFVAPEDEQQRRQAKIQYNFEPTMAFVEDRMILASSKQLAVELAASRNPAAGAGQAEEAQVNTQMMLDVGVLRQLLADNRPQLVAQNMLQEGHSKEAAEREISLLLGLVGMFQAAELSLDRGDSEIKFSLQVKVKSP